MIYSEPLFNQISRFVSSIGFGFLLCILYLALVFLRLCISDRKWALLTQDLLFGVAATVLSFFFMVIYNSGQVRFNLVFGQAIGAAVLYICFGRYFIRFVRRPALIIRKGIGLFLLPMKLYLLAFPKTVRSLLGKIKTKITALKKKQTDKRKKREKS